MTKCGKFYNNGSVNIRVKDGENIPDGFVPGLIKMSAERVADIVARRKKTCRERYGVENPSQAEEIKEKADHLRTLWD